MNIILPDNFTSGRISSTDVSGMLEEMEKAMILKNITFPIVPSSDGYYHVWIKDPNLKGGRKQFKAKSLDTLKEKVYSYKTEYKRFNTVYRSMMDEKLKYIKDEEKRLSVINTISVNDSLYTRYFAGTDFEKMKVNLITKKDLENIITYNLTRYDLRKRAFMNMRTILKTTLNYAYENYMVEDNVYNRIDFAKYNDMLIKNVPIRDRVHTDDEYNRILAYIHYEQNARPRYIVPYALELQMLAGLRRGEIPPLTWDDVADGMIRIYKELIVIKKSKYNSHEYPAIVEHTKTHKDRVFPITSDIRDLLNRIYMLEYNSEFIFPSNRTKIGCIGNQALYKFYRKACKDLGIEISKETMKGTHSFRRNAITRTANITGDMVLTSQLYGNSPNVARENYYTGIDLNSARKMLEEIG